MFRQEQERQVSSKQSGSPLFAHRLDGLKYKQCRLCILGYLSLLLLKRMPGREVFNQRV